MKFCIYFYHRHTLNTKSHTHVKKMGHTSEFHFGIYWWTLKNLKNQNFEKMKKKIAGDIIILHRCTKKHNHMRHSSWDTEWDNFFFLSFWAIFCPSKIWKTSGDIILLHMYTINQNHMMYGSWDIKCKGQP